MNTAIHLSLSWSDWLQLFLHYLMLSLLSVGGAITTLPDMHRYLVNQHGWLSTSQFNASVSIAQAAPGPNVLFIALLGWNVGLNAGSMWLGLLGMLITMTGMMVPSTTVTYLATRWGYRNRDRRAVRAFKQGLAPIVIGLLIATGWIMTASLDRPAENWPLWLLTAITILVVWRSKIHLLWLLALGAIMGILGWV